MYDRMIVGGAMPVNESLHLEAIEPLKQAVYLHSREIGIYNVGGKGKVKVGNDVFELDYKEALYLGSGDREVYFESDDAKKNPRSFISTRPPLIVIIPIKKSDQGRCGGCRNGLPRRLKPSEYQ